MISLASVELTPKAKKNLRIAIKEEKIGQGRFIKLFEQKFAKYIGTKYAVFVSNGTVADTLALCAIKDHRDEVIVPAFTFVAHVNSIIHAGLKPIFVDVDSRGQMDVANAKRSITKKTLALFPAHLLGRIADIKLKNLAKEKGLYLVEDCCEALGASWKGRKVGSIGDLGTFSFYASHHISTGEGGMITTNNKKFYETLLSLRNHGRKSEDIQEIFTFDRIGFNAKGSNLQAAIGEALIEEIEEIVGIRRANVSWFNEELGYRWYQDRKGERSSPHCYPIFFNGATERDNALEQLYSAGIESRKLMASIPNPQQCHAYQFLGYDAGDFPNADYFGERGLYVPCHQLITRRQLGYIAREIKNL